MSAMALSYSILSGSAVFSALVDLLTLFFLWKICASHRVALSRNSPVITNSADRLTVARIVDRLTVAKIEVRNKLHLSLESGVPHRGLPKLGALHDSPQFWNAQLYPERKARPNNYFAPPARSRPNYPLCLMPLCTCRGCLMYLNGSESTF